MANLLKLETGKLLAFVGKLAKAGMTLEEVEECLMDDAALGRRVAAFKNASAPDPATYTAFVKYGITPSFEDLRKEFDWVFEGWRNPEFTRGDTCEGVSTDGEEERSFELVHFRMAMSTANVIAELDRRGLRPATHEELLGFVRRYPDLQREFPILALGSVTVVNGLECASCADGDGQDRNLGLDITRSAWRERFRFLALRK